MRRFRGPLFLDLLQALNVHTSLPPPMISPLLPGIGSFLPSSLFFPPFMIYMLGVPMYACVSTHGRCNYIQ